MKSIFHMHKVTSRQDFEKVVRSMANQKSSLFHCYISGNIFKIATSTRVQEFDFSAFESEEEIVNYIQEAMEILRKNRKGSLILNS